MRDLNIGTGRGEAAPIQYSDLLFLDVVLKLAGDSQMDLSTTVHGGKTNRTHLNRGDRGFIQGHELIMGHRHINFTN